MRFVDEYRDPAAARALGRPHHRGRGRRPLQVHGGVRRPHAHHLPPRDRARAARDTVELVHGPGCPVCVIPMGRVDDAIAVARDRRRDLHVVRRHDARARAATATCSRPRRAAPTCASSTRRSTRCASRSRRPTATSCSSRSGSRRPRRRPPSTLLRARELGVTNFRVFCNHVTIVPPIKAILESPDLRLDGFLGPGHVSTVVGNRPYRFVHRAVRQAARDRRLRAARHPPGDRHAARADPRGPLRGREPVRPRRARRGQPAGAGGAGRGVRAAAALRVAGARLHLAERAEAAARVRRLRRRAALPRARACGSPTRRRASAARC